jgi:hypothetical protein
LPGAVENKKKVYKMLRKCTVRKSLLQKNESAACKKSYRPQQISYTTYFFKNTTKQRKLKILATFFLTARRSQCCGSGMFIPDPDPTFFHPGSQILIKEFKCFNPQKSKKMVSKL